MIEPSNQERVELPQCTAEYIAYLEDENEELRRVVNELKDEEGGN